MPVVLSESSQARPSLRPPVAWSTGTLHPDLRPAETTSIQNGSWFAELSETLRHAIVARARVRRVDAGTLLARRGDLAGQWIAVASGAIRLGTALRDGRQFTLDFVGPGQWYGDIALIDGKPQDLDVVAHVPCTLLLSKTDLQWLTGQFEELREAFMQLNCQRLRHMFHRFEELHTLPLAQRLASQVHRLARQFGRPTAAGLCIDLGVSQGDLAAVVGGSRQRVNRAWRQMHHMGIVQIGQARITVLDEERLDAVANGRVELAGSADRGDSRP